MSAAVQPDHEILRRKADFEHLYRCGKALHSRDVVLVYLGTEATRFRLAVIASRKVGNAVRRNRAKRLLREAHRSLRGRGDFAGFDLALIARSSAAAGTSRAIREQLAELYARAGVIRRAAPEPAGETSDSAE